MKQKTAMQQAIEAFKKLGIYSLTIEAICNTAIKAERQQIIDAFDNGGANGYSVAQGKFNYASSEDYFNQTFETQSFKASNPIVGERTDGMC